MAAAKDQLTYTHEQVTPAKAERWLNSNVGNRALREGVAETYSADMKRDAWTNCVDPIVFDIDGTLRNGQHRLWAVVDSGKAQWFFVVRGVPLESALNFDIGLTRSVVDNVRIATGEHLTYSLIATALAIQLGERTGQPKQNARSPAQKLAIFHKHKDAAIWVQQHKPLGKYLDNAAVRGAIGRAWYLEADKERLAAFAPVVTSGMPSGSADFAAAALRNWLKASDGASLATDWRGTFLRAQNAIWHFMHRKALTVLRSIVDERYPLKKGK